MEAQAARKAGLTIIDLGASWAPVLFSEFRPGDAAPQPFPYRQRYLDMANDRTDHRGRKLRAGEHNYLDLYGVPPTLSVVRKRFLDTELRECLADVDREALRKLPRAVSAWGFKYVRRRARALRKGARRVKRRRRLKSDEALARTKGGKRLLRKLRRAERRARAANAALEVLACEGMLERRAKRRRGRRRWRKLPAGDKLWRALTSYERKHMILGRGVLTKRLAKEMARTADEADADAFRRVLRERVVHAARIVEDGTARRLRKHWKDAQGRKRPLRDLVSEFTKQTLDALGLTSTVAIRSFLTGLSAPVLADLRVAVRLPDRPPYYGPDMDLEVVINRGDVYYDPPIDQEGNKVAQYRSRLPRLTLWVTHRGQRIPLVRWRTTVGGWNDELKDGQVYLKYKPSKVGERVWRDIVAAPIWIPPPTTPHREIVRGRKLKTDSMGPGPYSAYGLVAAFHLLPRKRRGEIRYVDQGIRTHGSYNYRSIRAGYSHGCHRLYNHLALRLFSFIVMHRDYDRVGLEPYEYTNRFTYRGRRYKIEVDNRGYIYRLTDPIKVTVSRGRVLGKRKQPIKEYIPKPGVKYEPDGGVEDSADGGVGDPADAGVSGSDDSDSPGGEPDAGVGSGSSGSYGSADGSADESGGSDGDRSREAPASRLRPTRPPPPPP